MVRPNHSVESQLNVLQQVACNLVRVVVSRGRFDRPRVQGLHLRHFVSPFVLFEKPFVQPHMSHGFADTSSEVRETFQNL